MYSSRLKGSLTEDFIYCHRNARDLSHWEMRTCVLPTYGHMHELQHGNSLCLQSSTQFEAKLNHQSFQGPYVSSILKCLLDIRLVIEISSAKPNVTEKCEAGHQVTIAFFIFVHQMRVIQLKRKMARYSVDPFNLQQRFKHNKFNVMLTSLT